MKYDPENPHHHNVHLNPDIAHTQGRERYMTGDHTQSLDIGGDLLGTYTDREWELLERNKALLEKNAELNRMLRLYKETVLELEKKLEAVKRFS